MINTIKRYFTVGALALVLGLGTVQGAEAADDYKDKVSGQGKYQFRVLQTRDILPKTALKFLEKAHGGFAVDRRDGQYETYFALPGAGIIQISADLASAKLVKTDRAPRNTNLHNTTIWYGADGTPYLSFPANDDAKVYTTGLDGTLVSTLDAPTVDNDFDEMKVNDYFAKGEKFVPTDVDALDGLLYITTGYSALDYVLTANINSPENLSWNDLVFGGKGKGVGQFGTGHGVTVGPDKKRINIADRPLAEIDQFTRYGHYRDTIALPMGAFPCDVDFAGGYMLVGCLHGENRDLGAPIYLLKDGHVISTIIPKAELGMERFQHIHNAVLRIIDDKLYIIAQAWNPGDFVILEQITE